jgi:hypothetical protein
MPPSSKLAAERLVPERLRSDRAFLVILLALYLGLAGGTAASRHYLPRYDSGAFLSAALSLHQGIGFRDLTSPVGLPSQIASTVPIWTEIGAAATEAPNWPVFVQYPPGLPLLLLPFLAVGRGSFLVLQLLPLLAGLLAILLAWRWREALFPEHARIALLLSVLSIFTLYAVRIQSEVVLAPLVLCLLRAGLELHRRPESWPRHTLMAGLLLLLAVFIHTKVFFLGLGLAFYACIGLRRPLAARLASSALLVLLGVLPALAWVFLASWRGAHALSGLGPLENPYFRADGWDPAAPFVSGLALVGELALRVLKAGPHAARALFFQLDVSGLPALGPTAWLLMGLCLPILGCLALGLWRARALGLSPVAFAVGAYLAGVTLSPWMEARMFVPVAFHTCYFLSLGLFLIGASLHRRAPNLASWGRRFLGMTALVGAGLAWAGNRPDRDLYAQEAHAGDILGRSLRAARFLHPESVVLAFGDNQAFSLLSGRASVSTYAPEWKNSNMLRFLDAGGRALSVGEILPDGRPAWDPELLRYREHFASTVAIVEAEGCKTPFLVVNMALEEVRWVSAPEPPALLGGIHPRWLELGPEDAGRLWLGAIPGPVEE